MDERREAKMGAIQSRTSAAYLETAVLLVLGAEMGHLDQRDAMVFVVVTDERETLLLEPSVPTQEGLVVVSHGRKVVGTEDNVRELARLNHRLTPCVEICLCVDRHGDVL